MVKGGAFWAFRYAKMGFKFQKFCLKFCAIFFSKMPSKPIRGFVIDLFFESISKSVIDFECLSGPKSVWGLVTNLGFGNFLKTLI